MRKKLFAGMLAGVMALIMLSGCNSKSGSGDTIKVGLNFELSGEVASYGSAEVEGIELAVEEINNAGGINGKKIELVKLDNKSKTDEATSIATKLATENSVVTILGPATSGATKATMSAANEYKVPVISPSATDDAVLTDNSGNTQPYGFRICFQDSFQGVTMANFASNNLKAKKAVILGDNSSDYAKGLADNFKKTFSGEVVAHENYTAGDKDFNAVLTKIKGKEFDVLFVPGYYEEAGLIIKQARDLGMKQAILGADGFDAPELKDLAGKDNLNNVYFSAHYSSLDAPEDVKKFIDAFQAKYNKTPNAFNALAYDTMYMLKAAIEKAGDNVTGETIKGALEKTENFKGVTGTVTVDEKHNAIKSAVVIELKDGEQTSSTIVKP